LRERAYAGTCTTQPLTKKWKRGNLWESGGLFAEASNFKSKCILPDVRKDYMPPSLIHFKWIGFSLLSWTTQTSCLTKEDLLEMHEIDARKMTYYH